MLGLFYSKDIHLIYQIGQPLCALVTRLVCEQETVIATFNAFMVGNCCSALTQQNQDWGPRYHICFSMSLRKPRRLSNESGKCLRDMHHMLILICLELQGSSRHPTRLRVVSIQQTGHHMLLWSWIYGRHRRHWSKNWCRGYLYWVIHWWDWY